MCGDETLQERAGLYVKSAVSIQTPEWLPNVLIITAPSLIEHSHSLLETMLLSSLLVAIGATVIPATSAESLGPRALPRSEKEPSVHEHELSYKGHVSGESMCDMYTTQILGSNEPTNQRLLMSLFVNTALVGNYTTPNIGVAVNGIMWPGEWKGKPVDLMPWFNGELASSNPCPDDCGQGESVNWLDGGGPAALRQNLTSFVQGTNQLYVSVESCFGEH
jgi:hypothetical protein